ncbi:histone methyltransferase set2 [Lithohypha guttulata]|nr:histone methyltransferase set2 [Lithohypha guttulata]
MARTNHSRNGAEASDDDTITLKREVSMGNNSAEEMSSTGFTNIKDELPSRTSTPASTSNKSDIQHSSFAQIAKTEPETEIKPEVDTSFKSESPKMAALISKKGIRTSKKNPPRVAPLFDHLPDARDEANSAYTVIDSCIYQNKYLGYTEHAMECDCSEEWDSATKSNLACGEDSDCINRATKMECVGDCTCGPECQNQRFWRRLYANVSVIKTEKKGYGLRANTALKHGDFIFEYIGEVIPEGTFRKRMRQYDDEGIKHFYFMSLSKGEFVDATKKGNLGRFCNHSCNPNCYVDKWVVGDKLRMGIFAERNIKPGEELVFNYNVDRYGANPQPCYCDEDNCTGFIGGKTQTEKGTKLSAATIEALGIDDEDWDTWDTLTAKKPKKKKAAEDDDEDYVERAEARSLDVNGITKVMAALMQCKEKWIAVKLLQRIQRCEDEDVLHRIVKLHGYKILNSQLSAWRDDDNVMIQILEILQKLPRLTRNKIVDAKIEATLEPLKESSDERVSSIAGDLLTTWSKLELAYRIPRKVRTAVDSSSNSTSVKYERRESQQQRRRSRSRSRSKSPPRGPANIPKGPASMGVPTGPRAGQRPLPFSRPPSAPFVRGPLPLPTGWFQTTDQSGRTYFYSASGETTWKRPSQPAAKPPPPPKQPSQQDMLKSIIDGIVTSSDKDKKDGRHSTPDTPTEEKKDSKAEKWRSLDEDKQKKIYENTLFPHIAHVMNKYKHKIPKDDLKRFAKDLAKKLVASDYKSGRVTDPTKISEKQQKKVKQYCKDYFEKAAIKHKKLEQERTARKEKHAKSGSSHITPAQSPKPSTTGTPKKEEDDEDIKMSDIEDHEDSSPSESLQNGSLKRKRSLEIEGLIKGELDDGKLTMSPAKKPNMDASFPTPPPPPPAPPADTPPDHNIPEAEEDAPYEQQVDHEPDVHADSSFKTKSMADVRALAQQMDAEDEVDWGMEEDEAQNGIKVANPLVEGQPV